MKSLTTIILVLLIVFTSMMIFREDREHYRMEAQVYRDAYVKLSKKKARETIEKLKFHNGRVLQGYWAIKDNRKDQWPYSEAEWKWHKGEKRERLNSEFGIKQEKECL